ncbi:hypothetical protein FACS189468_6980 [Spirochaetia bacterium]|nr:hypothetical protein FACS189468_6980 [Spirochaetia bacterium]
MNTIKIYLDTNVFTRLRNTEIRLGIDPQNSIVFFFSQAHILDLKNDSTNEKLLDLDFIESIAHDNYLHKYHNKPLRLYKVTPKEAFNEKIPSDDILSFDWSQFKNIPMPTELKEALNKIDAKSIDLSVFPPALAQYMENLFIMKDYFDISKLIRNTLEFQDNIENNTDEYKKMKQLIRKNSKLIFGKDNISINKDNIDKIFLESDFHMNFLDYIDKNIKVNINEEHERLYHRFSLGYNILNSFGFDEERNKKAKFKNTFNDGLHAFYASACDLLISTDKKMIERAKFMYNLLDISTKTIYIQLPKSESAGKDGDRSADWGGGQADRRGGVSAVWADGGGD